MITRAQMQRQLRNNGGVMTVKTIRKKYGLGSDLKDFVRKIIPNELADVAVKAAPFVAPFNPLAAAAMRGIGRFDQRGSISDALKQGAGTFAFGYGARKLGGADGIGGFSMDSFSSPLSSERTQALGSLFDKQKATEKFAKDKSGILPKSILEKTTMKIPGVRALPKIVQEQLLASGLTAGASLLASYFQGEFREQEPGETMEEYLAARKEAVGSQMRTYMDNYFKFDKDYSTMTDAERDAFVARYNVRDGGRIGYQTGGITMTNTLAQNKAINNARRAQNQRALQETRNKVFNVFMTPQGNVAKDQGIAQLARDTGKAPQIQNYEIKSGTDIARMIGPGTGIGNQSYSGGQQFSNLGFAALQPATTGNQGPTITPTTTVSQTSTAPDLSKQSEEYGKFMEQKIYEAYGKPEDYRAEAATLNMSLPAYMDYLLTSDPKGIYYKYRKLDPYYDPQFDMPRDLNEIEELSPLNVYYQRELQRQIDAGIPEAQRIQQGQVMGLPTVIPGGATGSQMGPGYESYADALARTRADMGLALGGRVGFANGTKKPRAYEVLIDKEGLAKEAEERADRINKLAEKISKEKGISFSDDLEQAIAIITPNTFSNDGKTNIDELDESPVTRAEKMANYKALSKLMDYGRQLPPFLKSMPIKYNQSRDDFETMQKERFMYDSPKMKKGGLMNIPVRTNSEGIKELDMRKTGGFVPIGVKEKADDVPAMLSKNEFVMTADAVRAAGGGSINKGAQRMYDTMKKLESRIA